MSSQSNRYSINKAPVQARVSRNDRHYFSVVLESPFRTSITCSTGVVYLNHLRDAGQADRYYSIVMDQEDGAMDSNGAIRVPCKVLDDRSG